MLLADHVEYEALMRARPGDSLDWPTLADLLARPAWHADAACRYVEVEVFFPRRGGDVRPARQVCADCPVDDDCRTAADGYDHTLQGIWAGESARDRRRRSAGRPGAVEDWRVRIAELHAEGLDVAAIAETVGVHPKTVYRDLRTIA